MTKIKNQQINLKKIYENYPSHVVLYDQWEDSAPVEAAEIHFLRPTSYNPQTGECEVETMHKVSLQELLEFYINNQ